jgi:hypothetical protein
VIYNWREISIDRAAVQFYPVEECWVHQNRDKRAIAILELDRKPSLQDCCKMRSVDFRFEILDLRLKKLKRLNKATSLINPGAGDEHSELFSRFTDESGGSEPNRFEI